MISVTGIGSKKDFTCIINDKIISYDLNTFEKLNEVEIKMDSDDTVYELLID